MDGLGKVGVIHNGNGFDFHYNSPSIKIGFLTSSGLAKKGGTA
jgi:hypothetical protein